MSTMSTAFVPGDSTSAPPAPAPDRGGVVLQDVSWDAYVRLCDESGGRGHRMWYDQGVLEIVAAQLNHEADASMIGQMLGRHCDRNDREYFLARTTTFRRQDLLRGFEGDAALYLANEPAVRDLGRLDLSIHPPPDVLIEVEYSSTVVNKLELIAAFGIPEVWRCGNRRIWRGALQNGLYVAIDESRQVPGFPFAVAEEVLAMGGGMLSRLRHFTSRLD